MSKNKNVMRNPTRWAEWRRRGEREGGTRRILVTRQSEDVEAEKWVWQLVDSGQNHRPGNSQTLKADLSTKHPLEHGFLWQSHYPDHSHQGGRTQQLREFFFPRGSGGNF